MTFRAQNCRRVDSSSQARACTHADFVRFAHRNLSETPVQRLRAELQQYFLLMSYQGYSNQFALHLAAIFYYGFAASLISSILLAVYWFVLR